MSREIKDLKNKETGQLVYPRTHTKAIVATGFNSLEDYLATQIPTKVSDLENDAQYATPILTQDKSLSISPTFPSNVVIGSDLTLNTNITNPWYYSKFSFNYNKWGQWDGATNTEYRAYNAVKINEATTDKAGFMTAEDKTKLDGIDLTVKQDKITIVDHGTADTTFTLTPNVLHKWGTVTNLTLTLGSGATGVANYYMFQFTSGSTATTLSIPATVKWSGGELNIEANKTYQVSILNNCAVIGGF